MKIALILPGLARSADRCYSSLKEHLLSKYETDIYIHTYEQTEISFNNSNNARYGLTESDLIKIYKPKKIVVENYEDVKNIFIEKASKYHNINRDCNAERTISAFYKIQKCFDMIDEKYDFYIRSRMDVLHETPISLLEIDETAINIPSPTKKKTRLENGYYYSYSPDYQENWIMDHFAIGNHKNMKNYCNIFNNLDELCIQKRLMLHAEFLTRQNLNYTNTKINRFFAEYSLHRREF